MAKKPSFMDSAIAKINQVAGGKKSGRSIDDSAATRRKNQAGPKTKKAPPRDTSPARIVGDHPLSGRRRRVRLDKAIDG